MRIQDLLKPIWASPCEKGTYHICRQPWLRQACTSVQSCQSLCCSLSKYMGLEEASDKEPRLWPYWAVHAHLNDLKPHNAKASFVVSLLILTHISLASHFWDKGKQCRPRSDAAECSVWSGSTLFAYRNFYLKWNENEKVHRTPLNLEMDSLNW